MIRSALMIVKTRLLLLCLAAALFDVTAATERSAPIPFTAQYTVSNDQYSVGTASLSLAPKGARWLMVLKTEPSGLFKLFSRGNIRESSLIAVAQPDPLQPSEFIPVRYTFSQKNAKPGRNLSADFKPSASQIIVTDTDANTHTAITVTETVYDPLSGMLHIMGRLATGDYSMLDLALFRRAKVAHSVFTFTPMEAVQTPLGSYAAVRVIRKSGGGNRETHTWYAKALNFMPIKIERYEHGELVARLSLDAIE